MIFFNCFYGCSVSVHISTTRFIFFCLQHKSHSHSSRVTEVLKIQDQLIKCETYFMTRIYPAYMSTNTRLSHLKTTQKTQKTQKTQGQMKVCTRTVVGSTLSIRQGSLTWVDDGLTNKSLHHRWTEKKQTKNYRFEIIGLMFVIFVLVFFFTLSFGCHLKLTAIKAKIDRM